jgi:diadenosine tetraphosphatase ApaH/serine/threonine PP2A family protein phosphatase
MSAGHAAWDADLNLDEIRRELDRGAIIGEFIVAKILDKLAEILYGENNVLSLQSPIVICGDIHGQYEDLKLLFERSGQTKGQHYLFMGDYVDRGKWSVNTFLYLATLKLEDPDAMYLLRGNHESRTVTQQYGFYSEIKSSYTSPALWTEFMRVFDLLPIAAVIDKQIFSVHGGLSPALKLVEQINEVNRKVEIPQAGVMADLTWSDPGEGLTKDCVPDIRGAGYTFGKAPADRFCRINRLSFVTRSHQMVQEGFIWMFADAPPANKGAVYKGRLINVWSAPNYGGRSGNRAAVMKLGFSDRIIDMILFDQAPNRIPPNDWVYEYFA